MLEQTKALIEDIIADNMDTELADKASECVDEISGVQHQTKLIEKFGLTLVRVIPINEENRQLEYLLDGEREHLVSADDIKADENLLDCLSETDFDAIQSGVCNDILLVNTL